MVGGMEPPKPAEYLKCCIIAVDTPYQIDCGLDGEHSPTGILKIGRVVWAKDPGKYVPDQRIAVYVEGIGLVYVASRVLRTHICHSLDGSSDPVYVLLACFS